MAGTQHPFTIQRLATLKARAAIVATEQGIKRTKALLGIAQAEGFASWEALMTQAGHDLGVHGEDLKRVIAEQSRFDKGVTSGQRRERRRERYGRTEERRVGEEGVGTGSIRGED